MSSDDERARREFAGEADELLEGLSSDLATLEAQGRDVRPEVINKIFREVHSLKGLAGMLGFTGISELAHALEDLLDRLRMGKVEITRDLIDLLYDSVDALNRLVLSLTDPSISGLVDVEALGGRIRSVAAVASRRQGEDPLSDLLLDEQTRRSLTEYEEHRLL
ncbi:MAG TPA: Hpt domain-containing protein, partial [Thermoanaerobaculia bacterium]|nr:Hpt domain-containing protein [Thermoanaerobaculia bacterium]